MAGLESPQRRRIIGLAGSAGLVTLLFVQPLARLLVLALHSELHSYIPFVPFISGYLLYIQPKTMSLIAARSAPTMDVAAVGFAALAASIRLKGTLSVNDDLSLMMLAYVSFIVAGGFLFLGSKRMAAAAFPIAFLLFMVPLPDAAVDWLELALVAASADAAALFFNMTGTPLFRQGTILTLPGIVLEVARECSGIRSTVVLFITSVLASHLFLQSTWRRFALRRVRDSARDRAERIPDSRHRTALRVCRSAHERQHDPPPWRAHLLRAVFDSAVLVLVVVAAPGQAGGHPRIAALRAEGQTVTALFLLPFAAGFLSVLLAVCQPAAQ